MHDKDRDLNALGSARFRTVREMCGVDPEFLAKQFNVNVRSAQRWDKTHAAPEIVVEWLDQWWETICDQVADALDELEQHSPDKTEPIILMRYHTQQSLEDAGLDMPLPIHNALIGHLAMAFSVEGYGVDIKWVVIDD